MNSGGKISSRNGGRGSSSRGRRGSKVRIVRESLGGGVEGSGLWMREGEVR